MLMEILGKARPEKAASRPWRSSPVEDDLHHRTRGPKSKLTYQEIRMALDEPSPPEVRRVLLEDLEYLEGLEDVAALERYTKRRHPSSFKGF